MRACLLLLSVCAVAAAEGPVPLKEVGLNLPRTLSGLAYKGRRDYEPKNLGYSVAYANRMCLVTVYVYDRGKAKIPDGKANPLVEGELKAALDEVREVERRGLFKNVRPAEGELGFPEAVRSKWAAAGFTFDVDGGLCKGSVLVAGRRNHFLKIRVTQYVVEGKANDGEVRSFLTELTKLLE
jgi:hypothetical protein